MARIAPHQDELEHQMRHPGVLKEHLDAAQLGRDNPGMWIELDGTYAPAVTGQIKAGKHPAYRAGWVATCRTIKGSKPRAAHIFVKYVGTDDDA